MSSGYPHVQGMDIFRFSLCQCVYGSILDITWISIDPVFTGWVTKLDGVSEGEH